MDPPTDGQTDIACHSRAQRSVLMVLLLYDDNLRDNVPGVKAAKRQVYGEFRREIDSKVQRNKNRSKDAKILKSFFD